MFHDTPKGDLHEEVGFFLQGSPAMEILHLLLPGAHTLSQTKEVSPKVGYGLFTAILTLSFIKAKSRGSLATLMIIWISLNALFICAAFLVQTFSVWQIA